MRQTKVIKIGLPFHFWTELTNSLYPPSSKFFLHFKANTIAEGSVSQIFDKIIIIKMMMQNISKSAYWPPWNTKNVVKWKLSHLKKILDTLPSVLMRALKYNKKNSVGVILWPRALFKISKKYFHSSLIFSYHVCKCFWLVVYSIDL